jgi:hypothetical protein
MERARLKKIKHTILPLSSWYIHLGLADGKVFRERDEKDLTFDDSSRWLDMNRMLVHI